jgi:hypothetical protein
MPGPRTTAPPSSSRAARVEVCGGNGLQRGADGGQQAAAVGRLAAGREDARASGGGRRARGGHVGLLAQPAHRSSCPLALALATPAGATVGSHHRVRKRVRACTYARARTHVV